MNLTLPKPESHRETCFICKGRIGKKDLVGQICDDRAHYWCVYTFLGSHGKG